MQFSKMDLKVIYMPFLCVVGFTICFYFYAMQQIPVAEHEAAPGTVVLPIVPVEEAFPYVIEPRTTLFSELRELEVPSPTIQQIVDAAKPVQNLANLRPGIRFQLTRITDPTPDISGIEFRFSAIERLDIRKQNGVWVAKKITEPVDIKVVSFNGVVNSSLWESALNAKMDPDLIAELADIFGWEVDFSREVRVNDRWRITVEQKTVHGEPVGWGAILAAEYINAGESHRAALFRLEGKDMGYYTPAGASLRKMFLKSPIRYGRITSHFNKRRFHPIRRIIRPHNGVDYGAPKGTPVRSVGEGTVIFAQRSGGGGNVIKVRHNATYQTAYKHLSGYARGLRVGTRVQQGQVIGYVGSTGLSTGPHLHFEFYQNNSYIDPLSKRFPSAEPVPADHLPAFKTKAEALLAALPAWEKGPNSEKAPASVPESH